MTLTLRLPDSLESQPHLAQLNIGRLRYPKGDLRAAEFFDNLERVNAIAERMPGFVWRLKDEGGDATNFRLNGDPGIAVNLSVWETGAALRAYVFKTVHGSFLRRRQDWFEPMTGPHMVLWPVAPGHIPDLREAAARLAGLAANGPSGRAFGWAALKD